MTAADFTGSTTNSAARPAVEHAVICLLAAAAIVAPVCLGASGSFARLALEGLMAGCGCLWAISGRRPPHLAVLPLMAAAGLVIQLMPLPDSVLVAIAPVSAGAWKLATAGLETNWMSVSVDPGASLVAIRRLMLAVATICVVRDLTRYRSHRTTLLWAIAASGAVILALGSVFPKTSAPNVTVLGQIRLSGPVYHHISPTLFPVQSSGAAWAEVIVATERRYVTDSGSVGDGFGSFIYSNHFAGAVILTAPILLAAWLALAQYRIPAILAYAIVAAAIAGIGWLVGFQAGSRGGLACFGVAALALGAFAPDSLWVRRTVLAAAIASACVLVAFVGLLMFGEDPEALAAWAPAILQPKLKHLLTDTRSIPARVAVRMFFASPVLGTGLDTYSDIFPKFHQDGFPLFYAHNDYAQWLAENGLWGGIFAALALMPLGPRCRRFWRDARPPYRQLSAGPWAALAGIAAHSMFDWNLHLPANAFLACLVLGLCLASTPSSPGLFARALSGVPQTWPRAGFLLACVVAWGFLARDACSDAALRVAREAIVADRLHRKKDATAGPADEQIESAIAVAERAARMDPRNASLAVTIGHLHLHAAGYHADAESRNALLADADRWFQRAKVRCAMCRGIPEPVEAAAPAAR